MIIGLISGDHILIVWRSYIKYLKITNLMSDDHRQNIWRSHIECLSTTYKLPGDPICG